MLNEEQKRNAVALAMKIETGEIAPGTVLKVFEDFPNLAKNLIEFWLGFNEMTVNVVEILTIDKCREFLERCYKL